MPLTIRPRRRFAPRAVRSTTTFGLCLTLLVVATEPAKAQTAPPTYVPPPNVVVVEQPAAPTYVYTDADRPALEARLVELRLARSQIRIGGPIAMISVGSAVTALAGLTTLGFGIARGVSEDGIGPDGTNLRRAVRVSALVTAAGGALVIAGGIRLSQRLRIRRQYDPEIFEIRYRLRQLAYPRYAIHVSPYGVTANLGLGF